MHLDVFYVQVWFAYFKTLTMIFDLESQMFFMLTKKSPFLLVP